VEERESGPIVEGGLEPLICYILANKLIIVLMIMAPDICLGKSMHISINRYK
jgi:hypothetical protein